MPTGGQWRTLETPPQAGASGSSDCGINRAVSVETFSRPPQSDSYLQEEFSGQRQSDIRGSFKCDYTEHCELLLCLYSIVIKSIPLPSEQPWTQIWIHQLVRVMLYQMLQDLPT